MVLKASVPLSQILDIIFGGFNILLRHPSEADEPLVQVCLCLCVDAQLGAFARVCLFSPDVQESLYVVMLPVLQTV